MGSHVCVFDTTRGMIKWLHYMCFFIVFFYICFSFKKQVQLKKRVFPLFLLLPRSTGQVKTMTEGAFPHQED